VYTATCGGGAIDAPHIAPTLTREAAQRNFSGGDYSIETAK